MLSLSLLLGLVVVVKLTRKGLPAVSWHWQALPNFFCLKELLLSLSLLLGLEGGGRALPHNQAQQIFYFCFCFIDVCSAPELTWIRRLAA